MEAARLSSKIKANSVDQPNNMILFKKQFENQSIAASIGMLEKYCHDAVMTIFFFGHKAGIG